MYERGKIWDINLGPRTAMTGREMLKIRPCVIINSNAINRLDFLRIIVPLIDWKKIFASAPWFIKIKPDSQNGLDKIVAADTFQTRCIDIKERGVKKRGELPIDILNTIVLGILICIDAPRP